MEAQCHLPRLGKGVTDWHHLSPLKPPPVPCTCLRGWPRQSSADSEPLFLFPWLSPTVPWSFLFGGAGGRREAEEGQYRWVFRRLTEQTWLPLYGKSTQCFTLEHPGLKLFKMQDKISLMPVACGGGFSWAKIYVLLQNMVWRACGLVSPQNTFLFNNIFSDAYNFPKYLSRELNFFWVLNWS